MDAERNTKLDGMGFDQASEEFMDLEFGYLKG